MFLFACRHYGAWVIAIQKRASTTSSYQPFWLECEDDSRDLQERWQVELFFKWIKQNLEIKSFIGQSKNAVLTQIWIALCMYLLLAYIWSMQAMLRLLQLNLFMRRDLLGLLLGDPPERYLLTDRQLFDMKFCGTAVS